MATGNPIVNMIYVVLRAAVWKPSPPQRVGLGTLIFCVAGAVASLLAYQGIIAAPPVQFDPYGLNAVLAGTALALLFQSVLVKREGRIVALSALMLLSVPLNSLTTLLAVWQSSLALAKPALWWGGYASTLAYVLQLVWWGGAVVAILRTANPGRKSALLRAPAVVAMSLAISLALPYEPVFRGQNFDIRTANLWEYIPALLDGRLGRKQASRKPRVDRAEVELAQADLLDAQIARLVPQRRGKTDIYAIGIAGSSDESVFEKELDGGLKSLARVLPLDGHVLRLINWPQTVKTAPIASRQNFATAVRSVARIMDRDDDVLLLFMTSHGSKQGVALWLAGAVYADLSPRDVAAVLDREGIKNRIVIVSACYSGVFLKPLENTHTIVLTASDESHPSFGCSNERTWTYFGDAFFNRNLLPGGDIEEAFRNAKVAITQWEVRDGAPPSNPQGYFGRDLMKKLAPLYLKPVSASAALSSTAGAGH